MDANKYAADWEMPIKPNATATLYDPPSGWRYGFPKSYKPLSGETLEQTLLRDGYPQREIDNGGAKHCRFIGSVADAGPGEAAVYAAPHKEPVYAGADSPRIGKWMSTFTGHQFWPLDPRAEEVDIRDVAHALSMTCRYGGHCLRFYSVAEHSVHVARWLQAHYGDLPAVVLKGLLHDAPEAYLTDVPRPIKGSLIGYKEIENRLWTVIANMHGMSDAMPAEVHEADGRILADEMAQNMTLADPDCIDPLGVRLEFWTPEQAEAEFLATYWSLIETGRM